MSRLTGAGAAAFHAMFGVVLAQSIFNFFEQGEIMVQRTISARLIAVGALTLAVFSISPSAADDSTKGQSFVMASLSSGAFCGRISEASPFNLTCRPNNAAATGHTRTAAVTCASNQWCCKHEDFSKGTCARCCSK